MLNLLEMPLVLAALSFTGGYVLAKIGAVLSRNSSADVTKSNPEKDKHLRGMEADLRVTHKKLEQAETELVELREERGELRAELDECREQLNQSTTKLSDVSSHLQEECEKTQSLRTELSERAEQSIRAQVQIRDMETELSLANTGTGTVQEEIDLLIAEREDLNDRLGMLQHEQENESSDDQRTTNKERESDITLDC